MGLFAYYKFVNNLSLRTGPQTGVAIRLKLSKPSRRPFYVSSPYGEDELGTVNNPAPTQGFKDDERLLR